MTAPDERTRPARAAPELFAAESPETPAGGRIAGYSRFVASMKLILPALALVLVGLIVLWPQVQVAEDRFRIGFTDIKEVDPEAPNMVNARFVGADRKNQPFSITADLAKNLLKGEALIELEMPKADITVHDGSWLVLTADTGVFDQRSNTLNLSGSVNLFHDSGYEFKTKNIAIDLNQGVASGETPVSGQGPFGNLQAQGFRLDKQGERIVFTGKSKLVIYPEAEDGVR